MLMHDMEGGCCIWLAISFVLDRMEKFDFQINDILQFGVSFLIGPNVCELLTPSHYPKHPECTPGTNAGNCPVVRGAQKMTADKSA